MDKQQKDAIDKKIDVMNKLKDKALLGGGKKELMHNIAKANSRQGKESS